MTLLLLVMVFMMHSLYNECNSKSFRTVFDDVVTKYADDRRVFFRTEPLPYLEKVINEFNRTYFEEITERILTRFPSSRVVNHYQLLLERSQNENRIRGNTHYHYGTNVLTIPTKLSVFGEESFEFLFYDKSNLPYVDHTRFHNTLCRPYEVS